MQTDKKWWPGLTRAVGVILTAAVMLLPVRPADAVNLYALVDNGQIFKLVDGVWMGLSRLPDGYAVALRARENTFHLYVVSRSGVIFHSTNGGQDWVSVESVGEPDVVDLHILSDGAILVLTKAGTVYRSSNIARDFTPVAWLTASDFSSLGSTTANNKLYALTRSGVIFESDSQGVDWVPSPRITVVSDAARVLARTDTLYVVTEEADMWRRAEQGGTWELIGTVNQVSIRGLVADETTLIAATDIGVVKMSQDGVVWIPLSTVPQVWVTALTSDVPLATDVESFDTVISLGAPFPNPALSGRGIFPVQLQRSTDVTFELIDARGRIVARSVAEPRGPGFHWIEWNPGVRHSGRYFVRVLAEGRESSTRSWVLLR